LFFILYILSILFDILKILFILLSYFRDPEAHPFIADLGGEDPRDIQPGGRHVHLGGELIGRRPAIKKVSKAS